MLEEAGELIPITGKLDLHRDYLPPCKGQLTRILEGVPQVQPPQAGVRKDELLRSRSLPTGRSPLWDKILDWMEARATSGTQAKRSPLSTFTVSYSRKPQAAFRQN